MASWTSLYVNLSSVIGMYGKSEGTALSRLPEGKTGFNRSSKCFLNSSPAGLFSSVAPSEPTLPFQPLALHSSLESFCLATRSHLIEICESSLGVCVVYHQAVYSQRAEGPISNGYLLDRTSRLYFRNKSLVGPSYLRHPCMFYMLFWLHLYAGCTHVA